MGNHQEHYSAMRTCDDIHHGRHGLWPTFTQICKGLYLSLASVRHLKRNCDARILVILASCHEYYDMHFYSKYEVHFRCSNIT